MRYRFGMDMVPGGFVVVGEMLAYSSVGRDATSGEIPRGKRLIGVVKHG